MSNTKQKIEELRQKLNELEQQLESEKVTENMLPPSNWNLAVQYEENVILTTLTWNGSFTNPNNVNINELHEKMESAFQLETWVLSNIREGEERDCEVYNNDDDWVIIVDSDVPSLNTIVMPERLAQILCDKLNSGEWKL